MKVKITSILLLAGIAGVLILFGIRRFTNGPHRITHGAQMEPLAQEFTASANDSASVAPAGSQTQPADRPVRSITLPNGAILPPQVGRYLSEELVARFNLNRQQVDTLTALGDKTRARVLDLITKHGKIEIPAPNLREVFVTLPHEQADAIAVSFSASVGEITGLEGGNLELLARAMSRELYDFGLYPLTFSFVSDTPRFADARWIQWRQVVATTGTPLYSGSLQRDSFDYLYGPLASRVIGSSSSSH